MKLSDQQKVNKIVKDGYELNQRTEDLANLLNAEGLRTESGKEFTASTVSNIAIRKLGLRKREKNTRNRSQKTFEVQEINFTSPGPAEVGTIEDNSEVKLLLIDRAVFSEAGKVFTDSLLLSEIFDKRHSDLLRDIEKLDCSKDFTQRNFALSEYKDVTGRTLKKYLLTKDGFSFLVFGYTGKKAAQFKEKFIQKFNEMEEALRSPSPVGPVDPLDIIRQVSVILATSVKDNSLKLEKTEHKVFELDQRLSLLENRTSKKKEKALISNDMPLIEKPSTTINLYPEKRKQCSLLVNKFATDYSLEHDVIWNAVYNAYSVVKGFNIKLRADKEGVTRIEYIELSGLIEEFHAFMYGHLIEKKGIDLKFKVEV